MLEGLAAGKAQHEVLNFNTFCEPAFKFGVLDLSRAIIVYDLELCIRELLDPDPTRFWQTSYFAQAKDGTHQELAQLLPIQDSVPRHVKGLENHQNFVLEFHILQEHHQRYKDLIDIDNMALRQNFVERLAVIQNGTEDTIELGPRQLLFGIALQDVVIEHSTQFLEANLFPEHLYPTPGLLVAVERHALCHCKILAHSYLLSSFFILF